MLKNYTLLALILAVSLSAMIRPPLHPNSGRRSVHPLIKKAILDKIPELVDWQVSEVAVEKDEGTGTTTFSLTYEQLD